MAIYTTKRWRKLRRRIFRRDGYRCRSCSRPGRLEVDHIIPIASGGDAWDPDNLQSLCRGCHIAKTADEHRGRERPMSDEARAWKELVDELL